MSWKSKVVVAVGVVGLTAGGAQFLDRLAPQTEEQRQQQQLDDQSGNLSDSQERANDASREDGESAADADARDRLRPGERRPPEPRIRIRVP